ncbi:ABC transporter substrate-binding protein [Alloyangia pacifica]|uniref:ABC transporter substrate-binding protein n=1 Tax=Alloyangia pacifica TaxID=311180 RepID=UPI001CFD1FB9|nr:ABC transporter substrate-binding protein [Alloyangia pacifica]
MTVKTERAILRAGTLALFSVLALPNLVKAQDIVVGLVSPNSGANARYGAFAQRGAAMAAEEINVGGGIDGRMIKIIPADSICTPVEGVSATQRLISQDEVDFIIGDICSSVTLAMQPLVEDAGKLLVNAASSNPEITYKAGVGGYQHSFRNYPTDEIRAKAVAEYAVEKGYSKFAVLSVDSDYGRGAITYTRKYLDELGAEFVSEDYYKEGEVDFRSVLTKIRNSEADSIMVYGLADTTPIIARQMIETGLAGKLPLLGNGEFSAEATIQAAPKAMEGAIEAAAWLPGYDSEGSMAFVADYKAKYDGEEPNNHAYGHWETMHMLAEAVDAADSTDAEAVIAALQGIQFASPMGTITFDDHHQAIRPLLMLEIREGEPVITGSVAGEVTYSEQ